MAITNGYCTLADVKAAARITDNLDDALIELSIEAASREIDAYTERIFYQVSGSRVFVPRGTTVCEIDDLVTATKVETADDGVIFDTTFTATDYQLAPLNGIASGLPQSFTQVWAIGDNVFPIWNNVTGLGSPATVKVTGTWGWAAIPTAIKQACVILAMRQFKRYDSPLGIAGFGDLGVIRVGAVDPDVQSLLMPFRKVRAA
jgi:hypothetical protein